MSEDPIEALLGLENLFIEENVIRLLSYDAVIRGRRIKVLPDGKEPICSSYFINDAGVDWASDECTHLYIASFGSEEENERLKHSGQVLLSYEHGRFNLEARRLRFAGVKEIAGHMAFKLSLPKIFQVIGRRKLVRHRVPSDMTCLVTVRKKTRDGDQFLKGVLFDLHREGLCFAAPESSGQILAIEDQLKLTMDTRLQHFGQIHAIVKIRSKAQYRKTSSSGQQYIYYGCDILNIFDGHMLDLYIAEIKAKETDVRKAEQTKALQKKLHDRSAGLG
ncbi:MAG: hypothetical protein HQL67_05405 [Magnetococcales bacterium]|nr:hypothetical protein [Magnetococcales bacterium]